MTENKRGLTIGDFKLFWVYTNNEKYFVKKQYGFKCMIT